MTTESLARALHVVTHRRRFFPYLIDFTSGDRLRVSHPEAVSQFGNLFLYRGPDHSQRIFDGDSVCQILVDVPPAS